MTWLNTTIVCDGRTYVHSSPIDDNIDHDLHISEGLVTDCVCRPRVFQVLGNGAEYSWQVVHHSLDGRELSET